MYNVRIIAGGVTKDIEFHRLTTACSWVVSVLKEPVYDLGPALASSLVVRVQVMGRAHAWRRDSGVTATIRNLEKK